MNLVDEFQELKKIHNLRAPWRGRTEKEKQMKVWYEVIPKSEGRILDSEADRTFSSSSSSSSLKGPKKKNTYPLLSLKEYFLLVQTQFSAHLTATRSWISWFWVQSPQTYSSICSAARNSLCVCVCVCVCLISAGFNRIIHVFCFPPFRKHKQPFFGFNWLDLRRISASWFASDRFNSSLQRHEDN